MFKGDAELGELKLETGQLLSIYEDFHEGKTGIILNNTISIWLSEIEVLKLFHLMGYTNEEEI